MNLRVNWLQIYANELSAISRMSSFPFFVNLSENIVCIMIATQGVEFCLVLLMREASFTSDKDDKDNLKRSSEQEALTK